MQYFDRTIRKFTDDIQYLFIDNKKNYPSG